MSSDLVDIFLLSFVAMINPALIGVVTVMILLPNPKRMMLGYLLGAYAISITVGVLIVFSLHGSGTESTAKHKISPLQDIVLGAIALAIALLLHTGLDKRFRERRQKRMRRN